MKLPQIRSMQDLLSGLLFLAIGLIGLYVARRYSFGSAVRMGPGYLPMTLSGIVTILGLITAGRSLVLDEEPIERVVWRPLILVLAAIAAFGLLIQTAGLVVTVIVSVIVGGLASRELRPLEMLLLALGLAGFSAVVFVIALGQPMPLWWGP